MAHIPDVSIGNTYQDSLEGSRQRKPERRGGFGMLLWALVLGSLWVAGFGVAQAADADSKQLPAIDVNWPQDGVFGRFDPIQLQRGFQVFHEVCAACHTVGYLRYRDLTSATGPAFTPEAIRTLAAASSITELNRDGESVTRNALLSDSYVSLVERSTFAGAAYPPDLSLIAKARIGWTGTWRQLRHGSGGPEYIYSLLIGYEEREDETKVGLYYNPYFPGRWVGMAPALQDGVVSYYQNRETPTVPETIDQYALDVAAFLTWLAEPKLMERKALGLRVLLFLAMFAVLSGLAYKKVWKGMAH